MAWSNGVYSRLYSWVTDRDNAIKIRADRMDAEFDEIVTALNALTSGGVSHIAAMKGYSGSVSLPGYSFDGDLNSGMYRIGADNIGFAVNGTKIIDVATTGVAVTGTLDASKGSNVASAATLNLDTATGMFPDITGTTTVTAVTLAAGKMRMARARGAFQITASASLIVNNSTSEPYTCADGDLLIFEGYASSVVRVQTVSGGADTTTEGRLDDLEQTVDFLSVVVSDLYGNYLGMARGWSDAFDTQDGIDSTASTNEVYDGTNDRYGGDTYDGNDSYTKVLLHFNGSDASTTITDDNVGGSAHTWTANGNAQLDTGIAAKFGTASLLCDGTGDYVSTPDHADFSLGSGDFTIDLWFNRQGGNGTRRLMAGHSLDGTNAATAFFLELDASNVVAANVVSGTTVTTVTGTTTFTATGWNHVEFVRTGNVLKLFVNGVQEGGNVAFSSTVNNSSGILSVGALGGYGLLMWNGLIDEFRLSVGIARHTANFTPPTRAYDVPGADNMELVSNAFAAPANVGQCAAFVDLEYSSSLTPGTDFDFAMSANNGSAYSSTGISYTLWYSSGNTKRYAITGLDLSAQADDAVRARFRTLTNKAIKITGWRPRWSDA